MKGFTILLAAFIAIGTLIACSAERNSHEPEVVGNFRSEKYLGTWYEIARLDYKWEEDLNNVTATYSLKENGDIKVDNKGYNTEKKKWEESIGKAEPVGDPSRGKLKVSFFGPFYSDYNVVALDPEYRYALVAGESTDYLWLLSREKTMPKPVKDAYLAKAKELGYNIGALIWVKHD
jgi:apolipoprotein D and lipocalin family protein